MSNFGVFQSSVMWRGENDKWFTRDNLHKFHLAVYQRWWVGAIYQRLSKYCFVPARVSLYPIFACMIYLHWKAEKVESAILIFGSYSFEFGVYPHLTIISHGFPGAGGKKEGAKSFSSYCTLYAFLRLGWNLKALAVVSILRSIFLPVSCFWYRTSHLLIKLAGGLEYSWSIPFFLCDFFDSRNQMKRVSSFHKEVFRISELAWFFFAGQVRISRAYWNGVFDLIPGTSWKYRPQNKGNSSKRLAHMVIIQVCKFRFVRSTGVQLWDVLFF